MTWELLDHTGDIGIRVRSRTLESLFEESAKAMFEQIADLHAVEPSLEMEFICDLNPPDEALRDWLAELLYNFSAEGRIYSDFKVTVESGRILGRALGEPYDSARHPLRTELKAVTYHQLQVIREKAGWKAQVIFDV